MPKWGRRSLQGPTTVHSFSPYLHMPFITGTWNCNELNKRSPKWVIKLPEYIMASSYWRSVLKHNCDVKMKKIFTFLNVQCLRNMSWSTQYLLPNMIYIHNHKYKHKYQYRYEPTDSFIAQHKINKELCLNDEEVFRESLSFRPSESLILKILEWFLKLPPLFEYLHNKKRNPSHLISTLQAPRYGACEFFIPSIIR